MHGDDSDSSSSESDDNDEKYVTSESDQPKVLSLQDDDVPLVLKTYDNEEEGEVEGEDEEDDDFNQPSTSPESRPIHSVESSRPKGPTADVADGDKQKQRKRRKKLYICLTSCKYPVVRQAARRFGFKIVDEDEDWHLYWTDSSVTLDRVLDMRRYQKINHFPGMSEICRKDFLSRNLNRMLKAFPKDYNIFPRSWCLPADYADFQTFSRQHRHKTYILKPDSSCQGKGIWITKNPAKVSPHEDMVCQVYLTKPYLIDGFKFDLRVYVLVASCEPLRIFCYKEGLARFCTKPYKEPTNSNVEDIFLHLTNYAVQKRSSTYNVDEEGGTKRRISTVCKYLKDQGADVDKMWSDVDDVIIKTIISAYAVLRHNYRTCFPQHAQTSACFEILGFDIIIDQRLRPFVLEVNHSPSFSTDQQIDKDVKLALIYDTLNLVNFTMCDKRRVMAEDRKKFTERLMLKSYKKESREEIEAAEADYVQAISRWEDGHMGNYRRIYPVEGKTERYERYCTHGSSLFTETAACKARAEISRQQREEIFRKQQQLSKMLRKNPVCPESPERRPSMRGQSISGDSTTTTSATINRTLSKRNGANASSRSRQASQQQISAPASPMSNGQPGVYHLQSSTFTPVAPPTHLPGIIDEQEEIARLSALMQRENLIRKLGIVDLIRVIVSSANRQQPMNQQSHHHHQAQQLPQSQLQQTLAGYGQQLPQQDTKAHSAATLAAIQHRLQAEEAMMMMSPSSREGGGGRGVHIRKAFALGPRLAVEPPSPLNMAVSTLISSNGRLVIVRPPFPLPIATEVPDEEQASTVSEAITANSVMMMMAPQQQQQHQTDETVINQDRLHVSGTSQVKLGSDMASGSYSSRNTVSFNQMTSQPQAGPQMIIADNNNNGGNNNNNPNGIGMLHPPPSRGGHASIMKSSSLSADLYGAGIQGHSISSNNNNNINNNVNLGQGITGIALDVSNGTTPKRVRSAGGTPQFHSSKPGQQQVAVGQLQAVLTGTQLRTGPSQQQQQQNNGNSWPGSASMMMMDDGGGGGGGGGVGNVVGSGVGFSTFNSQLNSTASNLLVRLPGLGQNRGLMSNPAPTQPLFLPAVLELGATNNNNNNNNNGSAINGIGVSGNNSSSQVLLNNNGGSNNNGSVGISSLNNGLMTIGSLKFSSGPAAKSSSSTAASNNNNNNNNNNSNQAVSRYKLLS